MRGVAAPAAKRENVNLVMQGPKLNIYDISHPKLKTRNPEGYPIPRAKDLKAFNPKPSLYM